MSMEPATLSAVVYPESDGKPMADNTLQWDWMVKIVGELRRLFAGLNVFIAGDLFWYPVEGDPRTVVAPDGLVVFGRPPGYRGSYKQWLEDDIAPQVVFEILSPSNTAEEMEDKLDFYERHGVEEYYVIDPYQHVVRGYVRRRDRLRSVEEILGFVSPRLGIRFQVEDGNLVIYGSDDRMFQTREEREIEIEDELQRTAEAIEQEREHSLEESRRADREAKRANGEATKAKSEMLRANAEAARADRERDARELLSAKLRELGVNVDDVLEDGRNS